VVGVLTDLLRGQHCRACGHPATRGDQAAERLGSVEQLMHDASAGHWMLVLTYIVACGCCAAIWSVEASAIPIPAERVRAWAVHRHHTLGLVG
jgi:hypothetical protein